ncbi:hypothetical protein HPP92_007293 [Vanilla planifolia]|uniref:Uncharacterized protein n=1 Tax=Vanilla planifolia TaxID=51239 RepID=A0A835RDT3_VANPL|nr:hypothetical protein HPP92_007293 [Vanilla planifolia]
MRSRRTQSPPLMLRQQLKGQEVFEWKTKREKRKETAVCFPLFSLWMRNFSPVGREKAAENLVTDENEMGFCRFLGEDVKGEQEKMRGQRGVIRAEQSRGNGDVAALRRWKTELAEGICLHTEAHNKVKPLCFD